MMVKKQKSSLLSMMFFLEDLSISKEIINIKYVKLTFLNLKNLFKS